MDDSDSRISKDLTNKHDRYNLAPQTANVTDANKDVAQTDFIEPSCKFIAPLPKLLRLRR